MASWWMDIGSVATLNNWSLFATLVFAALAGITAFLCTRRSQQHTSELVKALKDSQKRVKSLEKAAESIRRKLLETQQHQDISQMKLKSSKSSAEELRQSLLDARKRLEVAEQAIRERQAQASESGDDEVLDILDLELEPDVGLSESQREQLIGLLDPGPKGNVDIFCVLDDAGSEQTAKQIEEILASDGWKTNGVAKSAFTNPPQGIRLAVNSKETAPSYASFLQRVFSTIGIPVSAKIDKKYREWSLTIVVGAIKD